MVLLQQIPQPPPLFTATPASVIQDAERLVETSRETHNCIAASVSPETASFDTAILPIAHAENARILGARILVFHESASPDPGLREASRKARALLDDFSVEMLMREDLFALVDAVLTKSGTDESSSIIDAESRYLLAKLHQDHTSSGLKLPSGPVRDRFIEIKKRIARLASEFKRIVAVADDVLWLTRSELDGVPETILSGLTKGEGINEGKLGLRLLVDRVAVGAALRSARSAETRRRVHLADASTCSRNIPVFREVVVLRDEAARLLGYPNHAAFRMQEKMAKTPDRVNAFLSDLQSRFAIVRRGEIEKLKEVKRREIESQGGVFDGQFFSWDDIFYDGFLRDRSHRTRKSKPGAQSMVREYLPVQATVTAMLGIYEHLFGLRFREIRGAERDKLSPSGRGSDIVWYKDVQIYTVWDDDAEHAFLGYLYFDLYIRDGKYGNPSNFNIVPGFTRADGSRQYPATAILCSFPTPTPERPCLVGHFPSVLLFHELGHGIHDLVSKTTYARFHGPDGTPVDYGEIPSQVIENWCWIPAQLKAMSKHYTYLAPEYLAVWQAKNDGQPQPPEQLPDELLESIVGLDRPKLEPLHYLRQLSMCVFDMAVHQPRSHEEIEEMDIAAMWNNLRRSLCLYDDPAAAGHAGEEGHGYTTFQHLVGDYDAGYYSYLFSNVFSADIFHSVFKADPMDAQAGRRYRYTVLEKGGSQDGMKILSDFLGREPGTGPFHEELGLLAKT
ncbi:MepB [Parachaetomium inaequale]|uniref:MepB n=1 Tax=Parachaetomium inaequale TaxID=2588326 RepID=A0AAN6PAV6_9PEZI|nr:MepB [Parachaetomium inaequale]